MTTRPALLVFLLIPRSVHAQSTVTSPPVVPPTPRDSIYALRVDPAAYRGHDVVLLLEDCVVRLEADGRSATTVRQVAQILTPDGAKNWGEFSFWYTPGRQRVRINWMRAVDPKGKVLSDKPAHQQETSPAVEPDAPVYSDRRAIQATLGGVAPGTLVDYSYTVETVHPWLPGDFLYHWDVNGMTLVRRSRFTLDTPADMKVRVLETNVSVAPTDVVAEGRRIRRWVTTEVPAVYKETYAGVPDDVMIRIRVNGNLSWRDVGAWYVTLLGGRFEVTPAVVAAHAVQLKGAATLDDSLRTTYRWVAQDFRYVSLSLGDGGYQPRRPSEVFESRFGDCKDKTTLFVSLARRMGLEAYPVLVRSSGGVDSLQPSLKQFDHMIAAVKRPDRIEYLDVTADLTPAGELPPGLQGEVGLALTAHGAEVVVLPSTPLDRNRYDEEIVGALGLDGRFVGSITVSASGTEQYGLREQLSNILDQDPEDREATLRRYALGAFSTALVDSVQPLDGRDLLHRPRATVWFTATSVVGRVGEKYYFNLPLSTFVSASVLSEVEAEGQRRFPIDVAKVNSPSIFRSALEFQLPEGWKAELPPAVSVAGPFGYYRAGYRQVGRRLLISREMGGRRGILPPDSGGALLAWLKAVANDRTRMIVLSRGAGLPLATAAPAAAPDQVGGGLADVILGLGDLPTGAKLNRQGRELGEDAFLASLASTKPLESYERAFGAEQMVFTLGGSRLVAVQAVAMAFATRAEASRPLELLDLFDLPSFMGSFISKLGGQGTSLSASRPIALAGIGDRASGWMLELATPFAKFDVALMLAARGRVTTTIIAAGPVGLQDSDLAGLVRTMDDRLRRQDAYLTELSDSSTDENEMSAADSALEANTDVALNEIPSIRVDSATRTVRRATFARRNGWPQYTLEVEGRGFAFPFGKSRAVSVEASVTLHDSDAQALKTVLVAERRDRKHILRSALGETDGFFDVFTAGDSTTIEVIPMPPVGARSVAVTARARGMVRTDMDEIYFARGRLSAVVTVSWPPGGSEPATASAIAQDMLERMRRVLPMEREAPYPSQLVEAVRRVVAAEHAVDSLADARAFEAAFQTIDRARLARAPVGFGVETWNKVCWWAALYGYAARALPACDAAVAPDTTQLGYRDSRGLARALAGDLEGAKIDFAYVVGKAAEGDFLTKRTAWLDTLRAGTNPFTPQVVEQLKQQ